MGSLLRAIDDLVLEAQGVVDRISRWARFSPPAGEARRRFVIIQIDGLSRQVLERALAARTMPGLARLLSAGRLERRALSVGLPSSTPAFQAALMYGVHPDIPGFHYHDKREAVERYFPRPGVADLIEARHARDRRGIMEGGSCYGCIFTGGAEESLWTFARLLRPTRAGAALLRVPLSSVLLAWVVLKCCILTLLEVTRALMRLVADPVSEGRRGVKWLLLKIGLSIWARQFFTLAASSDLYRGLPAVMVNYLDYDVYAHGFGPDHRLARRALRRVDRSIMRLYRVVRRLPEWHYDFYVLSDHGQVLSRPFHTVSGGASIEEAVRAALAGRAGGRPAPAAGGGSVRLRTQLADYRHSRSRGLFQRFLIYLEHDRPWLRDADPSRGAGPVKVIAAGPNAFVYFTDTREPLAAEEIEGRHPGAAVALSEHPGIGFVLARSAQGPVCWYRGKQINLEDNEPGGPFDDRPDRDVVLQGLRDLMAMPSAGDLVLYGIGAPAGEVSFVDELGAHAGPAEAELQTFIVHPPSVALPAAPLTHPIQLYPHFAAYQERPSPDASASSGRAPRPSAGAIVT